MTSGAKWALFGVVVLGLVGAGLYEEKKARAASIPAGPNGNGGSQSSSNIPDPNYSAKPAAQALAAALSSSGCSASNLSQLCTAFQQSNNADAGAVARTGPLQVSGQFDQSTAAALAWYGVGTFAPCSSQQPPGSTPGTPSSAPSTAFLLYQYLGAHGCDGSATLKTLVQNFQQASNTDPNGDGPASPKPIVPMLTVSGTFDAATSAALATYSGQTIAACG